MEEIHQQRYLASELKIRREDFTDFGDIHAVRLGSVDLALPLLNGRMQTHSRQMLREFSFIGTVKEGDKVTGLILATNEGRMALLAPVTIDCTGDAIVSTLAGAHIEKGREDGQCRDDSQTQRE